jgi:hypothetical protein
LLPCIQEEVRVEETLCAITGGAVGLTLKVTGIVWGVFDAIGSVIVIVAE